MEFHFEKATCPKCGSGSGKVVLTGRDYLYKVGGEYHITECGGCGFWFQSPRPSAADIASLYPDDYLPYKRENRADEYFITRGYMKCLSSSLGYPELKTTGPLPFRLLSLLTGLPGFKRWISAVDLIPHYVPGGRLLEIGCANGNKLFAFKHMGWAELHGIELSKAAAAEAKASGFSVDCGFTEELLDKHPDGHFDVVIASMLIEHLIDPFSVARNIAKKLKPGGQFLFSTHMLDTFEFKVYREYCSCLDLPTHMVFLRRKDIADMLKDAFTDIRIVHQPNAVDFGRSSEWRREYGKPELMDRVVAKLKGGRLLEVTALLAAWAGLTNRVSVTCRKRRT